MPNFKKKILKGIFTSFFVIVLLFLNMKSSNAQVKTYTGTVVDETGIPMSGVTVKEKNGKMQTVTNKMGQFSIQTLEKTILLFSFTGYNALETLAGISPMSIDLKPIVSSLDDVVVVGYGTQKKRNTTGSIATVKSDQIRQVPITSPEQALQGRSTGVMVMQSNGAPGGASQVQVRGVNSTNAGRNDPLYVIDGIPLFDVLNTNTASGGGASTPSANTGSPLATLNSNDIESMEVLKDASATAIYGSRAANGVVVITTKTGKVGKTKIRLDYYYGVQSIRKKLDMVNATEGMLIRRDALLNTVSDGGFYGRPLLTQAFNPFTMNSSPEYKNIDWQNELFRAAPIQDANISLSGGTDKLRYLISTNFFKQDGIFRNTDFQRISTRVNLDGIISSKLKYGLRFNYSNQTGNNVEDANPFQGNVALALQTEAWNQVFNADGTYWGPTNPVPGNGNLTLWNNRNPVAEADLNIRPTIRNRTNANLFAEYEIIKGLKFKSSFGVDFNSINNRRVQAAFARGPYLIISGPDIPNNTTKVFSYLGNTSNWISEHTLQYNKSFSNHNIDVLLGFSAQQNVTRTLFGLGDGGISPSLTLLGANIAQNLLTSESYGEIGLVSQFIRANYNFKGKYLFSGTVRRDGSSNFGPDNKYGSFPAASIGWRLSDERFMKNVKFIQDIKIRASHGIVGNQNIGSFAFLPRMGASNYSFGNTIVNGFAPNALANRGLRWEENHKTDLAIEFSLFNGKLNGTVEYYRNRSKGLLVPIQVSNFSGFSSITTNFGSIENKGWEFSLNGEIFKSNTFSWNASINLTTVQNTVLDLGTTASGGVQEFFGNALFQHGNIPVNITRAGLPIGSFLGWRSLGVFQSQAETVGYPTRGGILAMPGDAKFADLDKNGVIDDRDREIMGSPFPNFFGGITNDFRFKDFSLNIFANFVMGNEVYNAGRAQTEQFLNGSGTIQNLNFWTPGSNINNPRLTAGAQSAYNRLPSQRFVEDGSFLRIRNITLAYQVPQKYLSKIKFESMRFFVSGSNLFTFTKYQGWDPEVSSNGADVLSGGIDLIGYPVAKTFQFGFNIGF